MTGSGPSTAVLEGTDGAWQQLGLEHRPSGLRDDFCRVLSRSWLLLAYRPSRGDKAVCLPVALGLGSSLTLRGDVNVSTTIGLRFLGCDASNDSSIDFAATGLEFLPTMQRHIAGG